MFTAVFLQFCPFFKRPIFMHISESEVTFAIAFDHSNELCT